MRAAALERVGPEADDGGVPARESARVPRPGETPMARAPGRARRRGSLAVVLACALVGCGLLPPQEIGFREYPLPDTPYAEAVELVQRVVKDVYTQRFGGSFSMQWDAPRGNLDLSPIEIGDRRMTLYVHLVPAGDDTIVEMFAVVKTLDDGPGGTLQWIEPKQDVHFEERVYEDLLAALTASRHFVQPDAARVARVKHRIAERRYAGAVGAGAESPAAYVQSLERPERPSPAWSLAATASFVGWIVAGLAFLALGLTPELRLRPKPALGAALAFAGSYGLWVAALLNA